MLSHDPDYVVFCPGSGLVLVFEIGIIRTRVPLTDTLGRWLLLLFLRR